MNALSEKVRAIFDQAAELATEPERRSFLEAACGGDAELRSQVEALLRSLADAGSFLEHPAAASACPPGPEQTEAFDKVAAEPRTRTQADSLSPDSDSLDFLAAPTRPDALGRLGHYDVLEVIGKGGFGVVLKAFDVKLHRVIAIKVLAPAFANNGAARKRFIREAQTAAAVKNEHVVAIHNVQDEAQPPYLVMELIDGIALQDKLDQKGPLSLREILRIGMQMAEGLAAAHKQGLVHRDIKPANILLENGVERVKITDFGLARAVDDASVTQSGTVAGTPMYMSPEQAEGLPIDHRSDLFSLGTVLYAMCTGDPPFRASGTHAVLKRVIDAAPRPIREINNEIPEWLCDIIAKLHAKKPEDRFQTAKEVAEILGQRLADVQAGRPIGEPSRVSDRVVPAAKGNLGPGPSGLGDPSRAFSKASPEMEPSLLGLSSQAWFAVILLLLPLATAFLDYWNILPGAIAEYTGVILASIAGLYLLMLILTGWLDWRRPLLGTRPWSARFVLAALLAANIIVIADWADPSRPFRDANTGRPVVDPERTALRGKWLILSGEANGAELPKEFLSAISIAFDDAFELKIGDFFESRNPIVLDGAASPKTMMGKAGPSTAIWRGEKVQVIAGQLVQRYYLHTIFRGIYELDGNKLKLCIAQGGFPTPKRFDSRTDDSAPFGALNLVLVRAPDERLQGKWDLVEAESNGEKWNFKGWIEFTGATGRSSLGGVVSEWGFRLNTSAQPKQIDFTNTDGTPPALSIYDLQGDTLIIAQGTIRPDSFKSQGRTVYRYRRDEGRHRGPEAAQRIQPP